MNNTEGTMSPALFSVTLELRIKQIVFPELLNMVSALQQNGYHVVFSTDGGRWLQIDCYQKSQQHSTLTLRRMLAKEPNADERMGISALNFALVHNSQVSFTIDPESPQFTVIAHKPSRKVDYEQIIQNCELLGIKLREN